MTTDPNPDPRVKNLRDAQRRLRSVLIANADRLDKPFTDDPDKNPWDTYVRPAMRELKSAVDAIAAPAAAVPVAAPPTTEQTAEARCAVCRRSGDDSHPAVCFPPAPADRAATLREAADAVAALDRRKAVIYADTIKDAWEEGRDEGAALLRRLAVEVEQAGGPSREATEPQTAAQTVTCGRTKSVCDTEYPPCGRPAGHEEAYCRSADGKQHFLAVDAPAVVAQPGKEPS